MLCPAHNQEMLATPSEDGRVTVLKCPAAGCGWQHALPARSTKDVQLKLAGLDRGRQQRVVRWKEEAVEESVRQAAAYWRASGWTILFTVHRVKFVAIHCPHCQALASAHCLSCGHTFQKFRPTGKDAGYGTTPGVPDTLARHESWDEYTWAGIELKGSHTPFSSKEQEALARSGAVAVARDLDQYQQAMRYVHARRLRSRQGRDAA